MGVAVPALVMQFYQRTGSDSNSLCSSRSKNEKDPGTLLFTSHHIPEINDFSRLSFMPLFHSAQRALLTRLFDL